MDEKIHRLMRSSIQLLCIYLTGAMHTALADSAMVESAMTNAYNSASIEYAHLHQEPITPIPRTLNADLNKAKLGEMLFHDTRLSANNQFSCASCHSLKQGGDDNLQVSLSNSSGTQAINTPTVYNAVFNFRQHWDGKLKNIEQQVDHSITSQHEFNSDWDQVTSALSTDQTLVDQFDEIYIDGLNRANIINAIVEFEKTLITPDSRFDQYLRNDEDALTEKELTGYLLFKESGCVSCHQGINIGGNLYQKFGVFYNYLADRGDIKTEDFGRANITQRQMDEHVFKVPSLRNIELTAPYLHDGSAETLEDAIYIMGQTQLGRELNDQEVDLIKAFLLTLTGEYNGVPLNESAVETTSPVHTNTADQIESNQINQSEPTDTSAAVTAEEQKS